MDSSIVVSLQTSLPCIANVEYEYIRKYLPMQIAASKKIVGGSAQLGSNDYTWPLKVKGEA